MPFIVRTFVFSYLIGILLGHIVLYAGGSYGSTGYNENEVSGHYPVGQNTYDGYGVPQV